MDELFDLFENSSPLKSQSDERIEVNSSYGQQHHHIEFDTSPWMTQEIVSAVGSNNKDHILYQQKESSHDIFNSNGSNLNLETSETFLFDTNKELMSQSILINNPDLSSVSHNSNCSNINYLESINFIDSISSHSSQSNSSVKHKSQSVNEFDSFPRSLIITNHSPSDSANTDSQLSTVIPVVSNSLSSFSIFPQITFSRDDHTSSLSTQPLSEPSQTLPFTNVPFKVGRILDLPVDELFNVDTRNTPLQSGLEHRDPSMALTDGFSDERIETKNDWDVVCPNPVRLNSIAHNTVDQFVLLKAEDSIDRVGMEVDVNSPGPIVHAKRKNDLQKGAKILPMEDEELGLIAPEVPVDSSLFIIPISMSHDSPVIAHSVESERNTNMVKAQPDMDIDNPSNFQYDQPTSHDPHIRETIDPSASSLLLDSQSQRFKSEASPNHIFQSDLLSSKQASSPEHTDTTCTTSIDASPSDLSSAPTTSHPQQNRQLSPYSEFLELLKHRECFSIVEDMKQFVIEIRAYGNPKSPQCINSITSLTFIPATLPICCVQREEIATRLHSFIERLLPKLMIDTSPFSLFQLQGCNSSLLLSNRNGQNRLKREEELFDGGTNEDYEFEDSNQSVEAELRITLSEQVERFLISKLFKLFTNLMMQDAEDDVNLSLKLDWMSKWISPVHLDINEDLDRVLASQHRHKNLDRFIPTKDESGREKDSPCILSPNSAKLVAQGNEFQIPMTTWIDLIHYQLDSLISAKYPRAKLTLLLNLCRIASELAAELIRIQNGSMTNHRTPIAADDLLPILIWIFIRSRPSSLLQSIEFVSTFRLPILLMSEDLYFFTMVASAAEFLRRLTAFSDLNVHDEKTRKLIISSCPDAFLSQWVGPIPIAKSLCPTTLTSSKTSRTSKLKSCSGPAFPNLHLPTSSDVSTDVFNPDVYRRFLALLRDPLCSEVVAHLRRFVETAFLVAKDVEGKLDDSTIRPEKVHSVVSIAVRMLGRMKTVFSWESVVGEASQSTGNDSLSLKDNSSLESMNTGDGQVNQFKKRIALIALLTECVERFIFGKIYHIVFAWLIETSKSPPTRESRPSIFPTRRLFTNILAPFSSVVSSLEYRAAPTSSTQQPGSSLLMRGSQISRSNGSNLSESNLNNAINTIQPKISHLFESIKSQESQTKAIEFVRKRLNKLDAMMSPREKLHCIITLCHIAGGLADCDVLIPSSMDDQRSTTNTKRVIMITEVALLLLQSNPLHLETNLKYIVQYRHRTLLGSDAQTYLLVVKVAASAIESIVAQSSCDFTSLENLKHQLSAIVIAQIPPTATRSVPSRFENEI